MTRRPEQNLNESLQQDNRRIGRWLMIAMWVVAFSLLTLVIHRWMERARNPNNAVVTSDENGRRSITLQQSRGGHYLVTGSINGAEVEFLVDTGATSVSVPQELAIQAGLSRGAPIQILTANGIGTAYRTRIASLKIGELEVRNATAHINPGLSDSVLLGMSVLSHYELIQRGDQLTIREP